MFVCPTIIALPELSTVIPFPYSRWDPPRVRCHWRVPEELYFEMWKSWSPAPSSSVVPATKTLLELSIAKPYSPVTSAILRCHWRAPRLLYFATTAPVPSVNTKKEFPVFDDFKILTGLRQKGKKRMPFWGKIGDNIYSIHSLHKNAFTFGFKAASDIVNLVK